MKIIHQGDEPGWQTGSTVVLQLPQVLRADFAGARAGSAQAPGEGALGHAEGLARGMAEAETRIAAEIERRDAHRHQQWQAALARLEEGGRLQADLVRHVLERLRQAHEAAVEALEQQAAALAFDAVCRVLSPPPGGHEQRLAELAAAMVRHALAALRGAPAVSMSLSPADLDALDASESGRALRALAPPVRWVADPELPRLSVVLATESGRVEASLERAILELREAWLAATTHEHGAGDVPGARGTAG